MKIPGFGSPPSYLPLILLLQHIRSVKIERAGGPAVPAAKLRVAPIADGEIAEALVDREIDERGAREDRIRDKVQSEPIEPRADESTDDDDCQPDLRIKILPEVKIAASTHRTTIHPGVHSYCVAERECDGSVASAAGDRRWALRRTDRQTGIALRTSCENFH